MKFIDKLKKTFPQFTWTTDDSETYFGSIHINPTYRRNPDTKAREIIGDVQMFISSQMREGMEDSFFYATCYQRVNTTDYKCKTMYVREHGKVFASGKTRDLLLAQLVKDVDTGKFINLDK